MVSFTVCALLEKGARLQASPIVYQPEENRSLIPVNLISNRFIFQILQTTRSGQTLVGRYEERTVPWRKTFHFNAARKNEPRLSDTLKIKCDAPGISVYGFR